MPLRMMGLAAQKSVSSASVYSSRVPKPAPVAQQEADDEAPGVLVRDVEELPEPLHAVRPVAHRLW